MPVPLMPVPLMPSRWVFNPGDWPDDDCVAAGADLAPETIISAYRAGAFPMPHGGHLLWWSPVERGVLVPAELNVSRSLRKSMKRFAITTDTDFEMVIDACADPARAGAWIDDSIRTAYVELHKLGWAHSVEARDENGTLVGGLYGLSIGGLFAGESMFHHRTDASKAALVGLVDILDDGIERLVDVQWQTAHLASLGVTRRPRNLYLAAISRLIDLPHPPKWV